MTISANWRDHAACRDTDPELFFPIGTTVPALRQIGEAKRICRACPVRARCLAWALDNGITDGVWGGTTEDERRAIRSLRKQASRGGTPGMLPRSRNGSLPAGLAVRLAAGAHRSRDGRIMLGGSPGQPHGGAGG